MPAHLRHPNLHQHQGGRVFLQQSDRQEAEDHHAVAQRKNHDAGMDRTKPADGNRGTPVAPALLELKEEKACVMSE